MSPNASKVFVTGQSQSSRPDWSMDLATVAYSGATGSPLWSVRRSGPIADGTSQSVVASPDGSRLFVGATSRGALDAWTLLAYATDSGARLWVARYDGPTHAGARVAALETSPDGTRIYVTGTATGSTGTAVYATAAFAGANGARLWLSRYPGLGMGAEAGDAAPGPGADACS